MLHFEKNAEKFLIFANIILLRSTKKYYDKKE